MADGYERDLTPTEAWRMLTSGGPALLVDVRTAAEWNYVGTPDLSSIDADVLRVEWQTYPAGKRNPDFEGTLAALIEKHGVAKDAPLIFICRSGARSASAAAAMTAAGHAHCYNLAGGFEGPRDPEGHRGTVEGWKAAKLPWVQP